MLATWQQDLLIVISHPQVLGDKGPDLGQGQPFAVVGDIKIGRMTV